VETTHPPPKQAPVPQELLLLPPSLLYIPEENYMADELFHLVIIMTFKFQQLLNQNAIPKAKLKLLSQLYCGSKLHPIPPSQLVKQSMEREAKKEKKDPATFRFKVFGNSQKLFG